MTSTNHRRLVAWADADPQGYAEYVRQYTGFGPEATGALLQVHGHLHDGKKLTQDHVRMLQALHPHVPAQNVAALCRELNQQHPGQRADLFLALMAGDLPALAGRVAEAGDDYKQAGELARRFHLYGAVEELNRRRDGGTVKPEPVERPTDPLSARALLEKQFERPGQREAVEMVNQGHPQAVYLARNLMADRMDAAADKLADDNSSMRDTVAAAYASAEIEAEAIDQGWLGPRED